MKNDNESKDKRYKIITEIDADKYVLKDIRQWVDNGDIRRIDGSVYSNMKHTDGDAKKNRDGSNKKKKLDKKESFPLHHYTKEIIDNGEYDNSFEEWIFDPIIREGNNKDRMIQSYKLKIKKDKDNSKHDRPVTDTYYLLNKKRLNLSDNKDKKSDNKDTRVTHKDRNTINERSNVDRDNSLNKSKSRNSTNSPNTMKKNNYYEDVDDDYDGNMSHSNSLKQKGKKKGIRTLNIADINDEHNDSILLSARQHLNHTHISDVHTDNKNNIDNKVVHTDDHIVKDKGIKEKDNNDNGVDINIDNDTHIEGSKQKDTAKSNDSVHKDIDINNNDNHTVTNVMDSSDKVIPEGMDKDIKDNIDSVDKDSSKVVVMNEDGKDAKDNSEVKVGVEVKDVNDKEEIKDVGDNNINEDNKQAQIENGNKDEKETKVEEPKSSPFSNNPFLKGNNDSKAPTDDKPSTVKIKPFPGQQLKKDEDNKPPTKPNNNSLNKPSPIAPTLKSPIADLKISDKLRDNPFLKPKEIPQPLPPPPKSPRGTQENKIKSLSGLWK